MDQLQWLEDIRHKERDGQKNLLGDTSQFDVRATILKSPLPRNNATSVRLSREEHMGSDADMQFP